MGIRWVELTNGTGAAVNITSVGGDLLHSGVDWVIVANTCQPDALAPGDTCYIDLQVNDDGRPGGEATGSLDIQTSAGTISVALTRTGI